MSNHVRSKTKAVALLVGASLAITGCSAGSGAPSGSDGNVSAGGTIADMEPVTFRTSTFWGPEDWATQAQQAFTDAVTEATDGKVTFEYYYADSLIPPAEGKPALESGLVDFARVIKPYTASELPIDTWISQVAFQNIQSPMAGTLQGTGANLEWGFANEEYGAETELIPILPKFQGWDAYALSCTTPVESLDDLQGLRVRVPGDAWANEIVHLGGVPVSMPTNEAYEALQRGLLDCFQGSMDDAYATGMVEVAPYFMPLPGVPFTGVSYYFNPEAWNALPLEAQQAIFDQIPVFVTAWMEKSAEVKVEATSDESITFLPLPDDIRASLAEYRADLLTTIADSAPGTVSDPQATLDSYSAAYEKWETIVLDDLGVSDESTDWADWFDNNSMDDVDLDAWAEKLAEAIAPYRP